MDERAVERLMQEVAATAEVIGDTLTPVAASMMALELSAYDFKIVQKALASCRRELKGRLSLASVLERIEDGHLSPNVAWALAINAADERNTVVWTDEVRESWAVCLPLMLNGDKIAARQAFLEDYGKRLKDAKSERSMANYTPSLGQDVTQRDKALKDAIERGMMTSERASLYLSHDSENAAFNPVALIGGTVELNRPTSDEVKARWDEIAKELKL